MPPTTLLVLLLLLFSAPPTVIKLHNLHLSAFDFLNLSSKLFVSSVDDTDEDDSMLTLASLIVLIKCLFILADVQLSVSEFLREFMCDDGCPVLVVPGDVAAVLNACE